MRDFIKRLLIKFRIIESNNEDYSEYVNIHKSTFLKNGLKIKFSTFKKKKKYLEIGKKGIINANFIYETAEGKVIIGNNVHIGGATFICRDSIIIGNDVTMAWDITIYDHNSHSIYWEHRKNDNVQCYNDYINHEGNNIINKEWKYVKTAQIIIADKVWIGFGASILKGVTIGEGAVVGARSVVTKNVEPWTVVAGNPAVIVKYLPEHKKFK